MEVDPGIAALSSRPQGQKRYALNLTIMHEFGFGLLSGFRWPQTDFESFLLCVFPVVPAFEARGLMKGWKSLLGWKRVVLHGWRETRSC